MTPPTEIELDLPSWERLHGVAIVGGLTLAMLTGQPGLLVGVALGSFGALVLRARGAHSAQPGFGLANWITTVRLLSSCGLLLAFRAPAWALAAGVTVILGLDAVDGAIARARKESSEFGAQYDIDNDAFLVLVAATLLVLRDVAGPWALLAGSWRYLYVLFTWLVPARRPDAHRAVFARAIYILMMAGLILALLLPPPWSVIAAALATAATTFSFGLTFRHRYAHRAPK